MPLWLCSLKAKGVPSFTSVFPAPVRVPGRQLILRKCLGKERRKDSRERMEEEGLKDRDYSGYISIHNWHSKLLTHRLHVCRNPPLPVTHPTVNKQVILSADSVLFGERPSPCDLCMCSPLWALKHRDVDCMVISWYPYFPRHYLVNKASCVDCGFWQMWGGWGSLLGKMDSDVSDGSPKMVRGNISLNEPFVIFRYSLSFLCSNYVDLSWGKDLHCEYITGFKNHQFINEMVPWRLGRFADVVTWAFLSFGKFYHI